MRSSTTPQPTEYVLLRILAVLVQEKLVFVGKVVRLVLHLRLWDEKLFQRRRAVLGVLPRARRAVPL